MSEHRDDESTGRRSASERGEHADHLDDLPDGSGCTEIWEHLSESRDEVGDGERDGEDEHR